MRIALAVAVVALLAAVATAEDGEVSLPVGDLLRAPLWEPPSAVSGRVASSGGTWPSRGIAGERELLEVDPWVPPPTPEGEQGPSGNDPLALTPETLETALRALLGRMPQDLRVEDRSGNLLLPAESRDAVVEALGRIRAARPPWVEVSATLEEVPASGAPVTLLSGRGSLRAGRVAVWADARNAAVLVDYDVELAQASVIANPAPQEWTTGSSLAIRTAPLPGGDVALVEVVARAAEPFPATPIVLAHPGFGPLDRCAAGIDEAGFAFLVRSGETSEHSWTGRDGRAFRLRVAPRLPAPGATGAPRLLWSPLLGQHVLGFSLATLADDGEGEGEVVASRTDLADVVPGWPGTEERLGKNGLAVFDGEDGRRGPEALAALAGSAAEALRGPTVRVRVLEVAAGQEVPHDGAPPQGATLHAQLAGPVLRGIPACAGGSREQMYVRDWEVEVAQAARIPDPQVSRVWSGHAIGVLWTGDGAGGASVLHVDVDLQRLDRLERLEIPLDVAMSSPGVQEETHGEDSQSSTTAMTAPAFPQDRVAVERPETRRLRVRADVPLGADGRGLLRRSASSFLGPGREIVVLVEAR